VRSETFFSRVACGSPGVKTGAKLSQRPIGGKGQDAGDLDHAGAPGRGCAGQVAPARSGYTSPAVDTPRLSVVIRSYNRIDALCELLTEVLGQCCEASFEVVVVEQSTRATEEQRGRLSVLAEDPRVRVLRCPPLGGPRARNVGARAARGDVLLFMDDDDLPAGDGWVAAHLRHFDDPCCLGVTGRYRGEHGGVAPRWSPERASRLVLSYVPLLRYQQCYNYVDVARPVRVATVHGGNVSLRRSALARFGLWDEGTPIEDELSFNYRLSARKRPDEYLLYDPEALMIRRVGVAGGMDKRFLPIWTHGERLFVFLHNILGHYFPVRFVLLYPAYVVLLYAVCCGVLLQRGAVRGVVGMLGLLLGLPLLWPYWGVRLLSRRLRGQVPGHEPRLHEPGVAAG
jgi:glycosyltransferase involved in cell wall biosynthesis